MNSLSKLCCHSFLVRRCLLQQNQARTIYDIRYLAVSPFLDRRRKFLDSNEDVKTYFESIQRIYKRNGIEALTKSQVLNAIHSASGHEECNDEEFLTSIVKSFCQDKGFSVSD